MTPPRRRDAGAVTCDAAALADIERHAVSAYPLEGCGVLLGAPGPPAHIVAATSGRNLSARGDWFDLDPADILAAQRAARERDLDIAGFWHSHPDGLPRPSRADTERAWEEYVYAVCAVRGGVAAGVGLFRLERAGGELVPLTVVTGGGGE